MYSTHSSVSIVEKGRNCAAKMISYPFHVQVSSEVVLSRSDDDSMKVKALEYAAPPGQKVWLKVRHGVIAFAAITVN